MACSAIGWAYAPTLPATRTPSGIAPKSTWLTPAGQQLDEPEGPGPRQQPGRNLAGKVPGKQDLRLGEDVRPPLQERDPGVAAEDLPVDPLELLVQRVAHNHLRQVQRPIGVLSRHSSPPSL